MYLQALAAAAGPPLPPPRPLMDYEVLVATGTKLGAGTDAMVSGRQPGMRTLTQPQSARIYTALPSSVRSWNVEMSVYGFPLMCI